MRTVTVSDQKYSWRFRIPTAKDWNVLAEHLAARIQPGDIIAISGVLGAGKTTFVQAFARELGAPRSVVSPTFALMRSYPIPGRKKVKRLLHVDAYRIESDREMLALDLDEELSDGHTVLVLEWPEKTGAWFKKHSPIEVSIAS